MTTLIPIRSIRRGGRLRIGGKSISALADTIVDLDDARVRKDLGHFQGSWLPSRGTTSAISAKDFGAKGDGATNDTAALTAWANAINAASPGCRAYLPSGQYLITAPLPIITTSGVTIFGDGWAQTAFQKGSCITATTGWSGAAMMTLAGEGIELAWITIDGAGRANNLVVTGANCRLTEMSTHGTVAGGVAVDGQTGSVSLWMTSCRINGINFPNTGIQLNDTDAIIVGCKPVSNTYNVVLLAGASGTILANNHMTPGSGGANCVFISGSPSHIQIIGNRFDNYLQSAIQMTPTSSTPNSYHITDNHFHSTVQTDNTYAAIALDTTASGVRALHIEGNSVYGGASNRPKWFLAAQKQDGSTPTNTTRLSSLGSLCSGNTAWAATAFFGNGTVTVARGNMTATDGQTYAAVVDV